MFSCSAWDDSQTATGGEDFTLAAAPCAHDITASCCGSNVPTSCYALRANFFIHFFLFIYIDDLQMTRAPSWTFAASALSVQSVYQTGICYVRTLEPFTWASKTPFTPSSLPPAVVCYCSAPVETSGVIYRQDKRLRTYSFMPKHSVQCPFPHVACSIYICAMYWFNVFALLFASHDAWIELIFEYHEFRVNWTNSDIASAKLI